MKYSNLLREDWSIQNLAQFRDGFIRPRSFPFHRLLPQCSKLHLGLTMPQQAGVRLRQTRIFLGFGCHALGDYFATSGAEDYL